MKNLKILISVCILIGISSFAFAEGAEHTTLAGSEFAYYFDHNYGYDQLGGFIPPDYSPVETPSIFSPAAGDFANTEPRSLGSGWGSVELQVFLKHRIKMPFLQGENGLVADNNVQFNFDLYVAPVAAYAKASATITPIAFLNFNAGAMLGSGWNAVIFNGVGNNVEGDIDETSFPGVVTELFGSSTFQFDLAALVPGEWNHVVTQINGKFNYSNFSTDEAMAGGAWQWLADSGENINGWEFKGTYFLGYQMPIVADTVGFLVETSQQIGAESQLSTMAGPDGDASTLADNGWGSDFVEVTFGPLVNFTFNEHNSLTVLAQFKTGMDYTNDTIFNQYYQNRVYEASFVKFNRIALAYTYKI
ncbi:MAG TPA: hypothetical protein DCO79_06620 [Spirochaeta sp.]|nr:hypothetical protein [Spirochaeta sp.]